MINPDPEKIESILNSSAQFIVPRYQREFSWGKGEAIEFIEDLKSYSTPDSGRLFLGNIIFDISDEKNKKIRVVDGQQRLTTILLLLVACRNLARKIGAEPIANIIQDKIAFVDSATAESLGPRLISSESIKDAFEYIVNGDWDGQFPTKINGKPVKRQVNRIKPVFDFFQEELKEYDRDKLSCFLRTLYEAYVVRINIQDETEAFNIFERTNSRGVDLEASDLLKNYLFASGVEDLEEMWPQINDNSDGNILRMLKYFYVSREGYISKSLLYRKIRAYGEKIGAQALANELHYFSRYYYAFKNLDANGLQEYFASIDCPAIAEDSDRRDKMTYALEGLRLFRVTQIYPLIFAALQCFKRTGGGDSPSHSKKFIRLIEILEKYHFVNNAICERVGNEVEKPYADYCKKYTSSVSFDETTELLIGDLKRKLASEEEFISRFIEISYASDSIPLILYIFDRMNNYNLRPGSRIKIYNPYQAGRKNHNIEHFYPRKHEQQDARGADIVEVIDNIGNLLAISFSTNSKLGNMTPRQKMEKMEGDLFREIENQNYIKEFLEKYKKRAESWDKKVIIERAQEMAKEAYSKVWKIE